ncbi:hypothetical protein [Pseudomonas sp. 2FE]|uniref:hypothetical protein n=1 Tax=Pseudomonas sp. 2FE TaxID=2502190 RepID=UPI0021159A60|nr:hypothetical protein [Pseudomonas sp. 2FE]
MGSTPTKHHLEKPIMKRHLILSLTLSVFAANTFALPAAPLLQQELVKSSTVAADGAERTPGQNRFRVAADGAERIPGQDRLRVAEDGAERTPGQQHLRVAEGGSDRLLEQRRAV